MLHARQRLHFGAVGLIAISLFGGCVGLANQLIYAVRGNKTPAQCKALEGKKVAVVCVSKASTYGTGSEASILAQYVDSILRREVKDIKLVSQSEVENWIDNNGWNELDYRDVGKGVSADIVLAIDVEALSLYEGSTLFKGRANYTSSVYDMKNNGEQVFRARPHEVAFPTTGGYHTTDMSEANFRREFLQYLARQISKPYYAYDADQDYGGDRPFLER